MTVSLDAYLDPQRMSFDSPNDLMARVCSPDDTFPVFSPPPFERDHHAPVTSTAPVSANTLMPPSKTPLQQRQHRRQSSLNAVSWPANHELTISPKMPHRIVGQANEDIGGDTDLNQQQPPAQSPRSPRSPRSTTFAPIQPSHRHRRISSTGSGYAMPDEAATGPDGVGGARRRSSFLVSLYVDDDTRYDEVTNTANAGISRRRSRSRSFWGPVGEAGLRDSIRSARSRSPVSHHECNYPFLLFILHSSRSL
ncbi:uncharacterized protein LOC125950133 [Anopheles darlingi]|uniref:uncharacterized protein LOC125950133 n=1 Tax=Anopheles darlingi TaxID=43151 RepID=UPI0021005FD6|nr:uncharacterized protein LOC125950133 [Anopheles darlingi]